jgi:hypothetical protein
MNPEQFFPENNHESNSESLFKAGEEIQVNLETETETMYELGTIVQNELFDHWPEQDQQDLILKLSGFYKDVTFEIVDTHSNGTIDIKPKGSGLSGALLGRNPRFRGQAYKMQRDRNDGRNPISDMANATLFGVNSDFFSHHETPVTDRYESLSLDQTTTTTLSDPREFVDQFGNALVCERPELPDDAHNLLKQASLTLFKKKFTVNFIYDDVDTKNPLIEIYCAEAVTQSDIENNGLELVQKTFDDSYSKNGTDLLYYLQNTRLKVSASTLKPV